MDWQPVIMSAGSAIVGAGLLASVNGWLKARVRKAEAEADAVKTTADAEAKATVAEAEVDHALAMSIQAWETRLAAVEAKEAECAKARADDQAECERRLAQLKGDTEVQLQRLRDKMSEITGRISVLSGGKPT